MAAEFEVMSELMKIFDTNGDLLLSNGYGKEFESLASDCGREESENSSDTLKPIVGSGMPLLVKGVCVAVVGTFGGG